MKKHTLTALKISSAPVVLGLALISSSAFAQAPKPADAAPVVDDSQTIVVTGSLVSNPNLSQSSPVIVTTSAEIALRQSNVAEEVLRDIPGVVPSIGSAVNNGNGGASFVDLRGLGSNRNIVLIDGNRIAPSGLVGRVDLNNIPLALVDHVESLTGGASTTYGADAISGVVNFITKKNFAGVDLSIGEKITEKGDGNYLRADLTVGGNFDEGKGNAVFSVGYQKSDPVYQGDRDFSLNNISSFSGTFGGSGTTVPSRLTGTRPIDAATGLPSVNPATANGGTRQINGSGTAVTTFALFNFNPYNIFQTPFKRYNMFGAARYEISDNIEVYTRGLFSKNNVKTIIAPSGSFGSSFVINLNNPYLPSALRSQYCAFDIDPRAAFYQPRFTVAQCAAGAASTGPGTAGYNTVGSGSIQNSAVLTGGAYDVNGDGVIDARDTVDVNPAVLLSRRLVEGGPRISDFSTTIFDYRVGVRGNINSDFKYDVSGSYGESENRQTLQGYVLTSRLRQALLANNTTTCITNTNGCVPLNAFGQAGSITAAQAAYLQQGSTTTVTTSLAQARALVSGNVFTIPGSSDPVQIAVAAEYRKYVATQQADSLAKQAGELGGAGGAAPDINGGYSVYEAYGELVAPIIQDKPGFEELTVKGGIRYSSYTVDAPSKPRYKTTTYKGEVIWAPVHDIKFRGGYSRAVRAPNISELFTPVTTGLTSLSIDPCAGAAPVGNANLRAVCLAQGAPAGTIGNITNPTAGQSNVTTGGNLAVGPEKSTSYTIGAVITPSFIPDFTATIDYYNIKVKGAITTPTPSDLITGCFGSVTASSASSAACALFRRNPSTGGLDGDVATTPGLLTTLTNQGQLKTSGFDLLMNYRHDLGFAKLALSFVGNYTLHSNFKSNQADPTSYDRDCTGYFSTNCASIQPKFQWTQRTTVSFDGIDISLLWRHIDKVAYEATASDYVLRGLNAGTTAAPVPGLLFSGKLPDGTGPYNFNFIRAYDYFDLSARFTVSQFEMTVGCNNLFNVKPPVVGSTAGTTGFNSGNTYPSTYDSLGRAFAASVKLRF